MELWRTDGTEAETYLLKTISKKAVTTLMKIDSQLFFQANDGVTGNELWASDGTLAGTVLFNNINTSNQSSFMLGQTPLYSINFRQKTVTLNGVHYFTANDGKTGNELWRSDGTEEGTVIVNQMIWTPPTFNSASQCAIVVSLKSTKQRGWYP